jgi:hypothetical protein
MWGLRIVFALKKCCNVSNYWLFVPNNSAAKYASLWAKNYSLLVTILGLLAD